MNAPLVYARICLAAVNLKIAKENFGEQSLGAVEDAVCDAIAHLEEARKHLVGREK